MVQESAPQTAQLDEEPGKRPPLRSRLWARTGLGDKTQWDLLQLLIVRLAAIGFWFTAQQEARQREIEDRRAIPTWLVPTSKAPTWREPTLVMPTSQTWT